MTKPFCNGVSYQSASGIVQDIDEQCFLKVKLDDGSEKLLSGGEVSIKVQ